MYTQITCTVEYTMVCIVCGKEYKRMDKVYRGVEIPLPCLPDSWVSLNGRPICDAHEIKCTASVVVPSVAEVDLRAFL